MKVKVTGEVKNFDPSLTIDKKEIKRIDKQRANHYKHYTGKEWKDSDNYDICINSDTFGVEKSAEIICDMLKSKTRV